MNKFSKLVVGVLATSLLLVGCSSGGDSTSGKTKIDFWHSMGGVNEEAVNEIVKRFNESQDEFEVVPTFQGKYEDALTKYDSVAGTKDAPAVIQVYDVGTKHMIESGSIIPVSEFIEKEKFDTSIWEENIFNYYQVDGNQYSMPFNSSTAMIYYNKDAFRSAGLDPEVAPKTFAEFEEFAKKLTIKEGSTTKQYGAAITSNGWYFEQLLAVQNGEYVNEGNGRSGTPTKALVNEKRGVEIFTMIKRMYEEGTFLNTGTSSDDLKAAFVSGQVAMVTESSAGMSSMVDNAPFEVGGAYLIGGNNDAWQGTIIGGGSLWMSNAIDEKEQAGAWEFMKFVSEPSIQAYWHIKTGYLAVTPSAYEEQIVIDAWKEKPQLKVAPDQIAATKASPATSGALIPNFPQARQSIVAGMESLFQGNDAQKALDKAAQEIENGWK